MEGVEANTRPTETLYGGFGWHRVDVVAEYGQGVITNYHIVSPKSPPLYDLKTELTFNLDHFTARTILDAEHQLFQIISTHPLY